VIFRIDDINANTFPEKLKGMISEMGKYEEINEVWLGVSMFSSSSAIGERVFPSSWKVLSDYTVFYNNDLVVDKGWIAELKNCYGVKIASHGIAHVDHRLLNYGAKEQSVLVSCKFLETDIFIPPFHKWDTELESICFNHSINLIRYELVDWKHASYNSYDPNHEFWYTHSHDWHSVEEFNGWLNKRKHNNYGYGSNHARFSKRNT
jgi:hypothetical protein